MRLGLFGSGLAANALLVFGCASTEEAGPAPIPASMASAQLNYSALVAATYADALSGAQALSTAVDAFLASPSAETLTGAREAWLDARESYLQSEAFRFYDGPIDHPDTGVEGQVNAWPMDESFIDYVDGDPGAGIINDQAKEAITAASLLSLNEQGGEENIATGFHAIEFLLWGQDKKADGPGDRSFGDFVDAPGGIPNVDRRRLYLETVTDLLVTQLEDVSKAWAADNAGNFRAEFNAGTPGEALRLILTGLTVLSGFETGGERLRTALLSGDQEDEHSCFSDNTHRDMVQDIRGVQNVWLGTLVRTDASKVEGIGLDEVIGATDQAVATAITAQIAKSLALAEALEPPFDQEILKTNTAGNKRVSDLIDSLDTLEGQFEELFVLYGLQVPKQE